MAWYVNELSLCGQYPSAPDFLCFIEQLLRARTKSPALAKHLFCSRTLNTSQVTTNMDFRAAARSTSNHTLRAFILAWLTKSGPFWDDQRALNNDDYFEHSRRDVTDLGLGEAARRQLAGQQASCFSFPAGGFDFTPIDVVHGLAEAPLHTLSIPNVWTLDQLISAAQALIPEPVNWSQMFAQAQIRFDQLDFIAYAIDPLQKEPFSRCVADRVFSLLSVLQEFMEVRNPDGSYSERNLSLLEKHFKGEKAWFSDESETNKKYFYKEMSFPDPKNGGKKVFCPMHGKIKTPQYRIHFEWPPRAGKNLRIFYIGPKITKS